MLIIAAIGLWSAGVSAWDEGGETRVGEALGKPGSATPSGVRCVSLPRTDPNVMLDGVRLRAGFALGGWLAFEKMGDQGANLYTLCSELLH